MFLSILTAPQKTEGAENAEITASLFLPKNYGDYYGLYSPYAVFADGGKVIISDERVGLNKLVMFKENGKGELEYYKEIIKYDGKPFKGIKSICRYKNNYLVLDGGNLLVFDLDFTDTGVNEFTLIYSYNFMCEANGKIYFCTNNYIYFYNGIPELSNEEPSGVIDNFGTIKHFTSFTNGKDFFLAVVRGNKIDAFNINTSVLKTYAYDINIEYIAGGGSGLYFIGSNNTLYETDAEFNAEAIENPLITFPSCISYSGANLYITDKNTKALIILNNGYELKEYKLKQLICGNSDLPDRLYGPESAAAANGGVYIADTENKRISVADYNGGINIKNLAYKPVCVSVNAENIIICSDKVLYIYNNDFELLKEITGCNNKSFTAVSNIINSSDGGFYICDNDRVLKLISGEIAEYVTGITNLKKTACNFNDGSLYVLYGNKIDIYNKSRIKTGTVTVDAASADIFVDLKGDLAVCINKNDNITIEKHSGGTKTNINVKLTENLKTTNLKSVCFDNYTKKIYFVFKDSFILCADSGFYAAADIDVPVNVLPTDASQDSQSSQSSQKLLAGTIKKDSILIPADKNGENYADGLSYEIFGNAESEEKILVFDETDGFYYIFYKGKCCFTYKENIELISDDVNLEFINAKALYDCVLFKYPLLAKNENNEYIFKLKTVSKDTGFTLLSKAYSYSDDEETGLFYKINLGGGIYYALRTSVCENVNSSAKFSEFYGKINPPLPDNFVYCYENPVLKTEAGRMRGNTSVKVTDESNGYYYVIGKDINGNDIKGWVSQNSVIKNGNTVTQLVGIIILLVLALFLVVLYIVKRNAK